jgi:tetratricopeptide (TPR) repeat protein
MTLPNARITLHVDLCAEGTATPLDHVEGPDPHDVVEYVLGRYGVPDAVLRAESGDFTPIGWVVPAPPSAATSPRTLDSVVGPVELPGAHIEIVPMETEIGFAEFPYLDRWLSVPAYARAFSDAGLMDAAGQQLPELWGTYRAAWKRHEQDPYGAMKDLLSVLRRARSAGAMTLAAHAADHAGVILSACDDHEASAGLQRWAVGQYRRAKQHDDLAMALNNLGHSLWHLGRAAPSIEAHAEARQLAILTGYSDETRRAVCSSTYPLIEQGRAVEALTALDHLGPSASSENAAWWHSLRSRCLRALGRRQEALSAAKTSLQLHLAAGGNGATYHDCVANLAAEVGDAATEALHRRFAIATSDGLVAPYTH